MPETPTTEAGRTLESRLAYDKDPAHYEHGDYFIEYRPLILAIEAEAAAAERDRHGGHTIPGFEAAYEAGRLDERERLLDPSLLSQAIHAYGGLCRSRYGRVTCGPADHVVMATDLRAAVLALLADKAAPGGS